MNRVILIGVIVMFNVQSIVAQNSGAVDSLKKWEISFSVNIPEPLTIAGFDYNALTQRIFINGNRREYGVDAGIGCSRKLRGSSWVSLNINYARYFAYELRDSRIYNPNSVGYGLDTLEIHQHVYEIRSGIFQRLQFNKIQLDLGIDVRFKLFSTIHGITSYSTYDFPNTFLGTVIYDQKEPGGFGFGFSPTVRFNYKIQHNFSIGVKYSSFISYYKTGGPITTTQTNIYSWGGTETGTNISSTQSFKGIRFFPICLSLIVNYSFY